MQTHPRGSIIRRSIVAALSSLFAFHAYGAPQSDTWYVGAQAGWVFASKACEAHRLDCDDSTAGGALFVGYVLNDWLALEGGYDYLGKINATYPALDHPALTADYESESQGLELVAKPYWSIDESWSVYGKIGTLYWHTDLTGHEVDFTHDTSDSDWSPLVGGGVEYAFNRNWSSTLEYRWINDVGGSDTGGADINMVTLGVTYYFASDSVPVPAPVAAPAAPAPQVEEKAAWSLTGPSFAYDSSILTPEHEQAMQPALERLKPHPQAHLNITTHTDSRGSAEYNQRLSDRRAESVREYFMTHGVQPNQLTATGMGESHPVADNNTEEGRYQNRRVELESPAFSVDTTVPGGKL